MLYSKLFGKTNKQAKEYDSINATLLQKAGFIDQVMAGVYTYLPLGNRVLSKIENLIRREMDKIASEILMPAIVPKQLWEKSGRLETVDVLMKTAPANAVSKTKNDTEYILSCTHEEVVTALAEKFNLSYKDFPFAVYQIQSKFRNEPRAKSGLLRGREFRMKDLYSFHTSEEDLKKYYEVVKESYWEVFRKIGIADETYVVLASGGDFTDDYSHEFQTTCETGEDTLFHIPSKSLTFNKEVAPSRAPILSLTEEIFPMSEVEGKGIKGVEALAKYLKIPVEKTTKTLIYQTDKGEVIAAAVRGGYEVNEEKLKKAAGCKKLQLASSEIVKKTTGAEVGYAGLLNLPDEVKVVMDESLNDRKNFEMGANKTDFHSVNVNFGRDLPEPEKYYDIKTAKDGDLYPETGEKYQVFKASEVGNIFPLNTKYSEAFNYYFTDEKGEKKLVYMGCYGIGSSRIMGVIAEKYNDDRGLIWPESVAPFKVHLIGLDLKEESIKKHAFSFYDLLQKKDIEVLFDDREDVSAGAKFGDADLIGIPFRLVISKRTGDKIEFKKRTEKETQLLNSEEIIKRFT